MVLSTRMIENSEPLLCKITVVNLLGSFGVYYRINDEKPIQIAVASSIDLPGNFLTCWLIPTNDVKVRPGDRITWFLEGKINMVSQAKVDYENPGIGFL
jgi:hypothetical protein